MEKLYGMPIDVVFDATEDESPIGYHIEGTPCYAKVRKCPKGGVVKIDEETHAVDLSIPENNKAFLQYIQSLPPAPMPPRLKDGSPKAALKWFEENMVGKRFEFDLPIIGKRFFQANSGHIFRFVCETPKSQEAKANKWRKGHIPKATSAENARELIRQGKVSSSECIGWKEPRARSLPMMLEILENHDAILHDRKDGSVLFLKKFVSDSGVVNLIVMRLNEDEVSMGPKTAHPKTIKKDWLNGQTLISIAGNKGPTRGSSSVVPQGGGRDSTESITRPHANSIAKPHSGVNGEKSWKEETSDNAPFDKKNFVRFLSQS